MADRAMIQIRGQRFVLSDGAEWSWQKHDFPDDQLLALDVAEQARWMVQLLNLNFGTEYVIRGYSPNWAKTVAQAAAKEHDGRVLMVPTPDPDPTPAMDKFGRRPIQ